MPTDPAAAKVFRPAALLADPARAAMILALADADRLATTDLSGVAGVSLSTASIHLAKLMKGGLVTWELAGRVHYYRIAHPGLRRALDALTALSLLPQIESKDVGRAGADRTARMCYDHLAGRLGVRLTESLLNARVISSRQWNDRPVKAPSYGLTKKGVEHLRAFGVDPRAVRVLTRSFAHACLDRTERRPHLAGSLGAALADRLLELGWLERFPDTRALRITPAGRRGFKARFGVES